VTSPGDHALEPAPLLIGATPTLNLAGPFHEITSVVLFPGGLAVADEYENEIRAFDLEGAVQSRAGGAGDGPREFPRAPHIVRDQASAEEYIAYDGGAKKVLTYDPKSGHLEPMAQFLDVEVHRTFGARGPRAASGGTLVFRNLDLDESRFGSNEDGPIRTLQLIRNLTISDGSITTIAEFDEPMMFLSGIGMGTVPFAPLTAVAASSSGPVVLMPGRAELRHFAPDGSVLRILRVDAPREPVTDDALHRYREFRDNVQGAESASPDSIPFFDQVLVDASDRTWARRYTLDLATGSEWVVFSEEGSVLGTVIAPPGLDLYDIGHGFVAGVYTSDLGEQTVRVFPLADRTEGG